MKLTEDDNLEESFETAQQAITPQASIGGMGEVSFPDGDTLGSGDVPSVADIDDDEEEAKKDKTKKKLEMEALHLTFDSFLNELNINEGNFEGVADLVKALHFELDPKTAEEMKIELGKRQGELVVRTQIEGGNYSLKRFRKEIKYGSDNKNIDLGVFVPGTYTAAVSTLGDGPHAKAAKKIKWNQKKYDQWLEDVASNDGWKNASDMAQNANNEPGLIAWVKKNNRGEDAMQRIQWDIEAFAESVVTEAKEEPIVPLLKIGLFATKGTGEKKLLKLSDDFEEIGDEQADEIASHLNMAIELFQDGYSKDAVPHFKKFNKACKDALALMKKQGLAESVVTEENDNRSHIILRVEPRNYDNMVDKLQDMRVNHNQESKNTIKVYTDKTSGWYGNSKAQSKLTHDVWVDKFVIKESVVTEAALTIPGMAAMLLGLGIATRIGLMSDEKYNKMVGSIIPTAKAIIKTLPIIGNKVRNQELKDYQTKEVEKYLKDEISDKDIVAILNENPKLKKAIEDVATSGLNYKDYYQLIKELGGAANKWGDAHRKFKQLRKKISDGKVLESVITEANGQTVKEFGDLLALLLDEDSGMDIERAIIAMPPKNARVLEKQISTLYKKLFDLTNQGFDLREDE